MNAEQRLPGNFTTTDQSRDAKGLTENVRHEFDGREMDGREIDGPSVQA